LVFDGTPFGGAYNVSNGTIPMNYIQIYSTDIFYANTNTTGTNITDNFGSNYTTTVYSLLTNASYQLFHISETVLYPQLAGGNVQMVWPEAASGYQLQFNDDLSKPHGWKTNANTSAPVLTNGFNQVQINTAQPYRFYCLELP